MEKKIDTKNLKEDVSTLLEKSTKLTERVEALEKPASSCMEYFKQGDRTNGSYTIRPDAELPSFEVICEFTENSGYTIIKPENWPKNGFTFPERSESRCTDPNCYNKKIEYGASKDQIKVSYHVIYEN